MAFGSQIAKLFGKAPSLPYRSVYINPFNGNNYLKYAQHDGLEVDEERMSFNTISQKQVKKLNPHVNNTVRNTKYTIWNFIFVLFIEQFSLHMNQYFLLLACMQLWSTITPVNPIGTWTPLIIVLTVAWAQSLLDDFKRYRADREANNCTVTVYRNGRLQVIKSANLQTGDLIYITEDEPIRADVVLLKSSDPNGSAYVETSALDGERDYKERRALHTTQILSEENIHRVYGIITCPLPNADLNDFDSSLEIDDHVSPLSSEQLLLQGTYLKSTDWIYAIVVYTGNESKIGNNKPTPKIKRTRMDYFINRLVVYIFLLQLVIGLGLGITGDVLGMTIDTYFYLGYAHDVPKPWYNWIIIPLRFTLLCSLMIPQSLKVTSDICKYCSSLFIGWDVKMYDTTTNTPAEAINTTICEDLGEIDYVFTDKTGTLTENMMLFKKFVLSDGKVYYEENAIKKELNLGTNHILDFFRTLLLCNSVFTSVNDQGETAFHSHSPDEDALVNFAREHGVVLQYRDHAKIIINILGHEEEYKILQIMEFSSERRRMSIIVQDHSQVRIFSKGSDDVILPRVTNSNVPNDIIHHFATEGLRTLCIAGRSISTEQFEHWKNEEYIPASTSLQDRSKKVHAAYDLLELEFEYYGTSAIEDALQPGVADCIESMRDAGIVVWMLTGDKKETAIQIGYSCGLITSSIVPTTSLNAEEITQETILIDLEDGVQHAYDMAKIYSEKCLVIEGKHMSMIIQDAALFQKVASECTSVICCRMSPIQKGQIVELMKATGKQSLAIGDGGNDVTMIRAAHVGVGISGKEGLQAVRAADFSIARFQFLKRLLFVHGRNSNRRLALISQYTMYKSFIIALINLMFSFASGFSGMSLFNTFILAAYSTLFTSLLPIAFLFDKDVSDYPLESIPALYQESKNRTYINYRTISLWLALTLYQAIVLISTYFLLRDGDMWIEGIVMITVIMVIQVCVVLLNVKSMNLPILCFVLGSFTGFCLVTYIVSILPFSRNTVLFHVVEHVLADPSFYFIVGITSTAAVLPLYLAQAVKQSFMFVDSVSVRRNEKRGTLDVYSYANKHKHH